MNYMKVTQYQGQFIAKYCTYCGLERQHQLNAKYCKPYCDCLSFLCIIRPPNPVEKQYVLDFQQTQCIKMKTFQPGQDLFAKSFYVVYKYTIREKYTTEYWEHKIQSAITFLNQSPITIFNLITCGGYILIYVTFEKSIHIHSTRKLSITDEYETYTAQISSLRNRDFCSIIVEFFQSCKDMVQKHTQEAKKIAKTYQGPPITDTSLVHFCALCRTDIQAAWKLNRIEICAQCEQGVCSGSIMCDALNQFNREQQFNIVDVNTNATLAVTDLNFYIVWNFQKHTNIELREKRKCIYDSLKKRFPVQLSVGICGSYIQALLCYTVQPLVMTLTFPFQYYNRKTRIFETLCCNNVAILSSTEQTKNVENFIVLSDFQRLCLT